jgi:putative SOS response-associated peptidase YedK
MINARAETLTEKPAYRGLLNRHRCLIPADGFYEWTLGSDGKKQPIYYHVPEYELFGFAGLWTSRTDDETGPHRVGRRERTSGGCPQERYDLAPQQRAQIIREPDDGREAVMAKWGRRPRDVLAPAGSPATRVGAQRSANAPECP